MGHSKTRYLVTGAAGFIGARFVESCNKKKIDLISVDRLSHFETRTDHSGLDFGTRVDRDLFVDKDATSVRSTLKELSGDLPISAVIHLGAITDTRESDPERLKRYNLQYSKTLCSYCALEGIPFIYASSAATYGEGELGYSDSEEAIPRLVPLNLYGKSKQDFDLWILENERNSALVPPHWTGFKFFNVYGYGEGHKGFMSSVVLHAYEQILKRGDVKLFKSHREGIADGLQKRDFVYVQDVVDVLHFAIEHPIRRGIFNLGSGHARSFLDLARAVFKAMNCQEKIFFIDTPLSIRDKYQYFTEAPMQKLRQAGFQASFTSLEEGVTDYVRKLKSKLT